MIQKTNKYIPRRNKYILEDILLNIFKFYILKYIIKIGRFWYVLKYVVYIFDRKKINL